MPQSTAESIVNWPELVKDVLTELDGQVVTLPGYRDSIQQLHIASVQCTIMVSPIDIHIMVNSFALQPHLSGHLVRFRARGTANIVAIGSFWPQGCYTIASGIYLPQGTYVLETYDNGMSNDDLQALKTSLLMQRLDKQQ